MSHEPNNVGEISFGSVTGLVSGWVAKAYAAATLAAAPEWFGVLFQAAVTLIVGCLTLITTHFLKRWLERRWPSRKRKSGDTAE